jgi:pantothenate kinase
MSYIGIPGSGKTTLSLKLKEYLNQNEEISQLLPMDGYHLYKSELSQFEVNYIKFIN